MIGYGLKLAGAGMAMLLIGILVIYLFSGLWVRISLGAALLIVFGSFLFIAWRIDRKDRAAREGLERI